jgi:hypothetical protein
MHRGCCAEDRSYTYDFIFARQFSNFDDMGKTYPILAEIIRRTLALHITA